MSQPSAPIVDLPTMDQESFSQAQLDQLFSTVGTDPAAYYQTNSEESDDLNFKFGNSYFVSANSPAPSSVATPNLSGYSFGQPSSGYPIPGPNTPHPYPIEQQQCFNPNPAVLLSLRQRPQPIRSQTNTSYLQPSHPPPQYIRRRSLSQGDIDHVAAINAQAPNPTFIRLQAPQSRSTAPDEHSHKRRAAYKHGRNRSTSQGPNNRGRHTRDNTQTSVPYYVNGMVPTRIGTPLSPASPRHHRPVAQQQWPVQDGYAGRYTGNDVLFRHMVSPEQLERSRKIIEIGALAVRGQLDPTLQGSGDTALKKLEEVERYIKKECGECDDALKGCVAIREVLTSKMSVTPVSGGDNLQDGPTITDTLDAPSMIMSAQGNDIFCDGGADNDDALMTTLMQQNQSLDCDNSL